MAIQTGYIYMHKDADISKLDVNTIIWTYKNHIYDNIEDTRNELIKTSKVFGFSKDKMKIVKVDVQLTDVSEEVKDGMVRSNSGGD